MKIDDGTRQNNDDDYHFYFNYVQRRQRRDVDDVVVQVGSRRLDDDDHATERAKEASLRSRSRSTCLDTIEEVSQGTRRRDSPVGLTYDVPPKYTVTIREICTTVQKADVSLIDGHEPHPCDCPVSRRLHELDSSSCI